MLNVGFVEKVQGIWKFVMEVDGRNISNDGKLWGNMIFFVARYK